MVEAAELTVLAAGLVLLAVGTVTVRKRQIFAVRSGRIAETDVSDVASLQPGPVAVTGTARIDEKEGTATASLSGEAALVSRAKVVAHGHEFDDGAQGRRVVHEVDRSVPFLVQDGTGTVRVDPPEAADLRLDVNTVARATGLPPAADLADREVAAANGTVDVPGDATFDDERLTYEQGVVAPGEEVYVYGAADDGADWDGAIFEIAGGENPGHFVVSDRRREDVQAGGEVGPSLACGVGGFVAVLGTLLLVVGVSAML